MKKVVLFFIVLMIYACKSDRADQPTVVASGDGYLIDEYHSTLKYDDALMSLNKSVADRQDLNIQDQFERKMNTKGDGNDSYRINTIYFNCIKDDNDLLSIEPKVGLDLPHKAVLVETEHGTSLMFQNPSYLAKRYNLNSSNANELIISILGKDRWKHVATNTDKDTVNHAEGIVEMMSNHDFTTTVDRLRSEIGNNQMNVLQSMPLSDGHHLFMVGAIEDMNKLIDENLAIAIDLPMKLHVYTDKDHKTFIAFNHPHYISGRYGIDKDNPILPDMVRNLSNTVINAAH